MATTRLTDLNVLRSGRSIGALKAVILSRDTCVAYAGDVAIALDAIRDAWAVASDDRRILATRLLNAHRESGKKADFLVASIRPSAAIVRVSGGKIEDDLPVAWIGDQEAFELYQQAYSLPVRVVQFPRQPFAEARRLAVAAKMSDAMRAVVGNPACTTVGEPIISLTSQPLGAAGFMYLCAAVGHDLSFVSTTGDESVMVPSSAADGGYNYTVLTPTVPGIGVVGVHFLQGKFGAVFAPPGRRRCHNDLSLRS